MAVVMAAADMAVVMEAGTAVVITVVAISAGTVAGMRMGAAGIIAGCGL